METRNSVKLLRCLHTALASKQILWGDPTTCLLFGEQSKENICGADIRRHKQVVG